MADTPRTINIFLRKNQVAEKIAMLNGGNGSAKRLFPGYPDLWDRYKAMGIKDIRTHDWFGLSDADTNIDPTNLSQPVFMVRKLNRTFLSFLTMNSDKGSPHIVRVVAG